MSNKSFIDLLFILLCGTIVLLSRSLQVGSMDAAPARVGGGGVSEVRADQTRLVTVGQRGLQWTDRAGRTRSAAEAADAAEGLADDDCVLLVAAAPDVSHHRVMRAWSAFRRLGCRVKLGAVDEDESRGGV